MTTKELKVPKWVPVYDAVNKDRLLGYIQTPSDEARGKTWSFAASLRFPIGHPADYAADPLSDITRAELTFHTVDEAGGWFKRTVFTTPAPLRALMLIPTFRLPGEHSTDAESRRHWQKLGPDYDE